MKILYVVIDGRISGGNNICVSILRTVKEAGNEVELLSPNTGQLTNLLTKEGVKIHLLRLGRSFYFHKAVKLACLLKKQKIDLIHAHTDFSSEILCRIACLLTGTPIICHYHAGSYLCSANPLIYRWQRWVDYNTSKGVFCFFAVSKFSQEIMINKRGYKKSKVVLAYNGIVVEDFDQDKMRQTARDQLGLREDETAIGLIGRLDMAKGQGTLIEAAPLVLECCKHTKFFIIGDDHINGQPSLEKYKNMIQERKLGSNCFLLGFRADMKKLIQALDIIVLPSLWEGLPLVVLEALAAKKPIIASAVGGVPEVITDNQEGLLISPKDPETLAKNICYLIKEPEFAKQLALRGYTKVKNEFNQKQMLNKIFQIYDMVKGR